MSFQASHPLKPTSANLETSPAPQPEEAQAELPIWLQRLFVIVYVVVCIELGLFLIALPWLPAWDNNRFLVYWPALRHFWQLGFVRGAISGLGLLDIWLGISEALSYRERR